MRTPVPIVVGFHGRVGAGKDTAAKALKDLAEELWSGNVKNFAFAEPGRETLTKLLAWSGITPEHFTDRILKDTVFKPLGVTPRKLLKDFLSGWGREMVHDDIWANYVGKLLGDFVGANDNDYVYNLHGVNIAAVTDVRKPNEADNIYSNGGFVIELINEEADSRLETKDDRYGTEDRLPSSLITYQVKNIYDSRLGNDAEAYADLMAQLMNIMLVEWNRI